jgi:hypothetical protein
MKSSNRKPPGYWKRAAERRELSLLRHMALLNEPHLTKVYTMARGHWVQAATTENMGSYISEEQYIGRWMSQHLEKEFRDEELAVTS